MSDMTVSTQLQHLSTIAHSVRGVEVYIGLDAVSAKLFEKESRTLRHGFERGVRPGLHAQPSGERRS